MGQRKILLELGENPEDWCGAPAHAIRNFISGRLSFIHRKRQRRRAQELRGKLIQEKGLYPGLSVFHKPSQKQRRIPAKIAEITVDKYIKLERWKSCIPPQQIYPSEASS